MKREQVIRLLQKCGCDIEYRVRMRKNGYPVCYITRIGDKKYTTDDQVYATKALEALYEQVMEDRDE